jgi:hypothetical protein
MPPETGEQRPATLGEAVSGVRWDYDPSLRLLSPLVASARYFEQFPWDGEEEPAFSASPSE